MSLQWPEQQGALPPPPGVTPDFENPPSIATSFQVGFGVCIGVSGLFAVARTYTRLRVMKKWGLDDYFMWISWLLSVGYIVTSRSAMPYGAGVHRWNVSVPAYLEFMKQWNIPMILYNPAICLVKLAILIQLLRIFAPARTTKMYWACISLSIITVLFYIVCLFLRVFQCSPREKIWNPNVPGTCIGVQATVIASASLNVVLDFVMLLLPVTRAWQLQIPKSKKWAIAVVFATGFLGCIASIMRLVTSVQLKLTKDSTYILLLLGVWCEVEITSGIICYCLPVFPQLYRQRIKKMFSVTSPPTYSHSGVYNIPSSHTRHFDGPRGGREPSYPAGDRFLWPKDHYVDLDKSVDAEDERTESLGYCDSERPVAKVYAPLRNSNHDLENGQIRRTTSVSVELHHARNQGQSEQH